MDPKGSKDSAFNSWVKTLTSTYLDLFIRLAAVYFAIFLIQDMIVIAINSAIKKIDDETEKKMGKFGNIPGLF